MKEPANERIRIWETSKDAEDAVSKTWYNNIGKLMGAARDKFDKRSVLGRDPCRGLLAFKTGAITTRRDRLKNRNSKQARNYLRKQLSGD